MEKGIERNDKYGMEYSGEINMDTNENRKKLRRSKRLLLERTVLLPRSYKNLPAENNAQKSSTAI